MDQCLAALKKHFQEEPYARIFGIEIVELEEGRALLKMQTSSRMNNLFGTIHGAATYSLLDAAFELAVNSHGTVAVALSVNVNYLNAALPARRCRRRPGRRTFSRKDLCLRDPDNGPGREAGGHGAGPGIQKEGHSPLPLNPKRVNRFYIPLPR